MDDIDDVISEFFTSELSEGKVEILPETEILTCTTRTCDLDWMSAVKVLSYFPPVYMFVECRFVCLHVCLYLLLHMDPAQCGRCCGFPSEVEERWGCELR